MVVKNGKHRLVGFVDLGESHDLMTSLSGTFKALIVPYVISSKAYMHK